MNAKSTYTAALIWTALMVSLARMRWLTNARDFIGQKTHKGATA